MLSKPVGIFLQLLGAVAVMVGIATLASGALVLGGVVMTLFGVGLLWLGRQTRGGAAMSIESGNARREPPTGNIALAGITAHSTVTRGPESWQFFAFVFAAAVTVALTLADEIPDTHQRWRIATKLVTFFGLAYLTLVNVTMRNWLAWLLGIFKEER
jgi:hypothetical protein